MGPDLVGVEPVLQSLAAAADATVLVGYHYSHTQRLTELAAAFGPTIVIPTAHPEGAFHVGAVRRMFEHADEVISLAPEEGDLVAAVHGCGERVHYVPCPVEPLTPPPPEAVAGVASRFGVTVGRYLVVVGRVDPAKGSDDAVDFVGRYRRLVDPSARLVVVGPGAGEGGSPDGVVATGFVDEATKEALVAGAGVVLQPSYMESFSLALVEGWLLDRPALVQGRSRVLAGHVARSGGGLTYTSYDDFEVAAAALLADPVLSARLAAAGHAYARTEFAWDRVAPAFLEVMTLAARSGGRRLGRRGRVST
jgi:glycosyltransferase involved in cell wall biosynthesis